MNMEDCITAYKQYHSSKDQLALARRERAAMKLKEKDRVSTLTEAEKQEEKKEKTRIAKVKKQEKAEAANAPILHSDPQLPYDSDSEDD